MCCGGERKDKKRREDMTGRRIKGTLKTDELLLLKHGTEAPTFSFFSTVALARDPCMRERITRKKKNTSWR